MNTHQIQSSVGSTDGSAWISVKSRKPKDAQTVICLSEDGIHEAEFWMRGCRGCSHDAFSAPYYGQDMEHQFRRVTHWMPMPILPNTPVTDAEPSTPANTRAQGPRSV